MRTAVLFLILVRSGAVLTATGLVLLLARRNPALRVAAARYGLLGAALVSLATPWIGERTRPVVAVPDAFPAVAYAPAVRPVYVATPEPTERSTVAPPPTAVSLDFMDLVIPIWAAGTLLLFAGLGGGVATLARVRRDCRPIASAELAARIEALAAEAGIPAPALVEGERVAGPCVAGVRGATVLLPLGWAATTDSDTVDAVLRHELAHVANGDLRWGLFARFVRIVLWPQPLVWLLRRPLAAAEEEACDRQVLAAGISQARYAAGLLELRESQRTHRVPSLSIGAVSRRSGFGRRIEAILDSRRRGGGRLSRRMVLTVRGGTLALALGAAFTFAHPGGARQTAGSLKGWVQGPYAGAAELVDKKGNPVGVEKAWIVVEGHRSMPTVSTPRILGNAIRLTGIQAEAGSSGVLAVRARGYGLTMVKLWPAPKRITQVRAAPATSLTGRLLLPDGRAAAGLRIVVPFLVQPGTQGGDPVFLQPRGIPGLMPSAVTDPTGAFRLDGLPPETNVQLDVDDVRYAQFSMNDRPTTESSGTTLVRTIRLKRAARIAGRVTRNGRPVAGVRIYAQANTNRDQSDVGAWSETTTATDGWYALERLAPTVYNVGADLSGGLEEEVTARAHEGIEIKPGTQIDGMDFDLVSGTIVEGTVTRPDGRPLPKATVGAYGPARPASSAIVQATNADARGHYRLRIPAGEQQVYLMDSQYAQDVKHVTTTASAPTRLDLRAAPKVTEEQDGVAPPNAVAAKPDRSPSGSISLPNGASARVAFLQVSSTWNPDGAAAATESWTRMTEGGSGFDRSKGAARQVRLGVAVRPVPGVTADLDAKVIGLSSASVWRMPRDENGESRELIRFWAAPDRRTVDVRVRIAAGPYRTAATGRADAGSLVVRTTTTNDSFPRSRTPMPTVTIRFPESLEGKDVRLAAYTKDGRRLDEVSWEDASRRNPKTGEAERTYGFYGYPGAWAGIDHVALLAREYEEATFRGIRLDPQDR